MLSYTQHTIGWSEITFLCFLIYGQLCLKAEQQLFKEEERLKAPCQENNKGKKCHEFPASIKNMTNIQQAAATSISKSDKGCWKKKESRSLHTTFLAETCSPLKSAHNNRQLCTYKSSEIIYYYFIVCTPRLTYLI